MLKRCQVLLNDWLVEYIKAVAEEYDVSFSEVLRSGFCVYLIQTISGMFPEAELRLDEKNRIETLKKGLSGEDSREQLHSLISQLYFEARRAVEYRMKQKKKGNLKRGRITKKRR